jgi:DNA-binding SARP family transcriptional activator/predicted ATPase
MGSSLDLANVGLNLSFLGGIKVEWDGVGSNEILPGKALALVCYLAETRDAQARDKLAGLLWSDFPDHRARSNLRDTLSFLRRTPLAPYLEIGRRLVCFNSDLPYWMDTAEFLQVMEQPADVRKSDPSSLEAAIALYQGEFLMGFQLPKAALFEEWVTFQREHMHLLAVEALQQLVEFDIDAGGSEAGISYACRVLTLEPWREKNYRNLMLLLILKGEYHDALKRYEQCRQMLNDELGVDPSRDTLILHQNILRKLDSDYVKDKLELDHQAPMRSGPTPRNIPGQVTPFIGREKEQRAIDNVLQHRTARLITIMGPGGSGKTRLALAVAEKQLHKIERDGQFRFPDGVYFVPLEAVESAAEIIPAICHALCFQPASEARAGLSIEGQLLDFLSRKRLLLIIDNFEQLMSAVGLLARIHRSAADVHLLVTSRQKLGLQGERLFALKGLRYPIANDHELNSEELLNSYSAAALFAAGALRLNAGFQLQDIEVAPLIRLCRMVDGLPLAIELAAGWTAVLSITDIETEIEQKLSFLESRLHDLPDRHRNIEAVFDVSWRRLIQAEQAVFGQLCVFRGGFSRHSASQVTGTSLRQLANLVNKALIQYDKKLDRYQIHRLLRQFGAEKLTQDKDSEITVRDRHCSYFSALLQQWDSDLKGSRQIEALIAFDKESANVRSAWNHAVITRQISALDKAIAGLGRLYLWRRRFHEGESACHFAEEGIVQIVSTGQAMSDTAEMNRTLARVRIWQSVFCDRTRASALVEQAIRALDATDLAAVDTRREQAYGLSRAGDLALDDMGDKARRLYERSLVIYRELADAWGIARVSTELGWAAAHRGEIEEARQHGEEAFALVQTTGDRKQMADVLWLLGTLAILQGQIEESSRLLGESLDLRKTLGDRITDIASGPLDLGMTLTWIGRMVEADEVREETLTLYQAQGQPEQIALAHVRLVASKFHMGQFEAMERHALIGLELCRRLGDHRGAGLALWHLGAWALFTGKNDQAESLIRESLASFRRLDGAIEISWVIAIHAELYRRQGSLAKAKKHICKALRKASGALGMITILSALGVYMNLLMDEGHTLRGVEIGAVLEKHPLTASSLGFRMIYADRLAEIKAISSAKEVKEAEARGRSRDLQDTAKEILTELDMEIQP